jgi:hypothetical protein
VVTEVVDEFWSVLVAKTSTVLPGAVVPVTVTGEPEIDEGRRRGHGQRGLALGVGDVAVRGGGGWSTSLFAAMSAKSRTKRPPTTVSGDAEPAGFPFTNPIDAVVGSVPNGGAAVGELPVLLGDDAHTRREAGHGVEQCDRVALSPVWIDCSPGSADRTGQR